MASLPDHLGMLGGIESHLRAVQTRPHWEYVILPKDAERGIWDCHEHEFISSVFGPVAGGKNRRECCGMQ